MAGPTRISQLTDGSPVQPTDQIPAARGSGSTGFTYKVNAERIISDLFNVANTPTVNLSFDSSTRTLSATLIGTLSSGTVTNVTGTAPIAVTNGTTTPTISISNATTSSAGAMAASDKSALTVLQSNSAINVVDSSTINLDWNSSTRTLSADASYLLSLINTLSTNMQNIGNYPYLEYACVTTPASAGQIIPANTITTLILNTEIADSGNFGSLASNQITLSAGTYIAEGEVTYSESTNNGANSNSGFGLYNISDSKYITRGHPYDLAQWGTIALKTQFTITSSKTFDLRFWTGRQVEIRSAIIWNSNNTTLTTPGADQRNTIRFWKVG